MWHTLPKLRLPLVPDVLPVLCLLNLGHRGPRERSLRVFCDLDRLEAEACLRRLVSQKCGLLFVQFDLHDLFLQFNFIKVLHLLDPGLVDESEDAATLEPSLEPHHVRVDGFLFRPVFRLRAGQRNASKRANALELGLSEIDFDATDEFCWLRLGYFDRFPFVVNGAGVDHLHFARAPGFILLCALWVQVCPALLLALLH